MEHMLSSNSLGKRYHQNQLLNINVLILINIHVKYTILKAILQF